jgi:LacI family transcriptional regulator
MTVTKNNRRVAGKAADPGRRRGARSGVITLKDIAAATGVSAQTVSRVINNTGSISSEVRERIRLLADQMGYVANKSAKAMRTGRSHVIGFVASDMRSPFFPELARSVERAAAATGYAVLLVDAQGSVANANDMVVALKSHLVDGVIVMENSPALERLDLPVVVLSDSVRGRDTVISNDVQGGSLLAEYLLSKGHQQIGMITSHLSGCVPIRRDAFINYPGSKETIRWERYTTDDETIGDDIVAQLKRLDVTALVCSHDVIAIRALRTLWDLGIGAPLQMSLVGFDDIPWASLATPSLTTIRQPFDAMGSEAVRLLIERIRRPTRRMQHITLDVALVERESVRSQERARLAPRLRESLRVGAQLRDGTLP